MHIVYENYKKHKVAESSSSRGRADSFSSILGTRTRMKLRERKNSLQRKKFLAEMSSPFREKVQKEILIKGKMRIGTPSARTCGWGVMVYLWNPREVQSRNSGGQPHTGTGGMSWWRCFQTADDDAGLGFGGQQSPHRSEVFWEGLFLVLNARPPMGADGHRFSPNSPSPLLPCLPGFFVSTTPPCLPPAPVAPRPIAEISTVLHLEKRTHTSTNWDIRGESTNKHYRGRQVNKFI